MKIVFFGTPDYVLPVLDALHKAFKPRSLESPIAAVVTQPPKPIGRKQQLEYSPADNWAHKKKIPIFFDPNDIIKNKIQADIGILASYGRIITKDVIDYFPHGILNIHFSLLPELRGAAPIPATLVMGKKDAGVTIFRLDELLDHGQIVLQFTEDIPPEDTTGTLMVRLFVRSAEVLETLIPAYLQGKIKPHEQDHSKATYTREIKKEDAFIPPEFINATLQGLTFKGKWKIDFIRDFEVEPIPEVVERFVRAMQPWPGTWTEVKIMDNGQWLKRRLKILKSHLSQPTTHNPQLVIDEVQLEGKNPVSWKQFQEGYATTTFE